MTQALDLIKCPICREVTPVSEEVKQAFVEVMEQRGEGSSLGGLGEEEQTEDDGQEELSANPPVVKRPRRQGYRQETSEGEEEAARYDSQENESSGANEQGDSEQSEDPAREQQNLIQCLLEVPCGEHPDELSTHYSPILRRLLCPQCLLDLKDQQVEHNAKPIRRVLPLILNSLEDQITQVGIDKDLAENRLSKIDIRQEQMKGQVESVRKKIDLKFEEVLESIHQIKRDFFRKFDCRWNSIFEGIGQVGQELAELIGKFEGTIAEIGHLQRKVVAAHQPNTWSEELVVYMLQIQSEIEEVSSQNIRLAKEDAYLEEFDRSYRALSLKLSKSLEASPHSIYQSLRNYFTGLLGDEASAQASAKASVLPPKPDPKEAPAADPHRRHLKDQSDLLADLRDRLKQYEKAQAAPSRALAPRSRDEQPSEDEPRLQPFRKPRPSQESVDLQPLHRPLDSDRLEMSEDGRHLQQDHRHFAKPKRLTVDYRDSKYLCREPLIRNPSSSQLTRPLASDHKYALNRSPAGHLLAAPNNHYASHSHLLTVKPPFVRDPDPKRPNTWLFECMKTMNDLKSFRENVRSKLNHSSPIYNKPSSKLVSPRYKLY